MEIKSLRPTRLNGASFRGISLFPSQLVQHACAFILTVYAARLLPISDYGIYAVSMVFVEFFIMLTQTGFFHFNVNHSHEEGRTPSTIFWILLFIGILGAASFLGSASMLANLFRAPNLEDAMVLLSLMPPLSALVAWPTSILIRQGEVSRFSVAAGSSSIISTVVGIVALSIWPSLLTLIFIRVLRGVISAGGLLLAARTTPKFIFDLTIAAQAAKHASGLIAARLTMFVTNFGADLLLGLFFSTSEAGLYRFANSIASAGADLVLHPIRLIGLDRFRNAQRADRYRSLVFAQYADLSIFLVGAISILVASTAPWFIPLAFHSDFAAAIPLVQIVAFRHFARVGQGWIEPVAASNGKGTQAFRLNVLIAIASVSGLGFGSTFGPTFIAQWTACVQILSIPVILLSFHRHCGIDVQPALPPILKTSGLLALLAMAAGAMSTKLADIFELSWINFSVFGVVLMLLFGIASAARSTISSKFTGSAMHPEGGE